MVYRRKDSDGKHRPHYFYRFHRDGITYRVNTGQTNKAAAEKMEAEHKTRLAMNKAGLPSDDAPTLAGFEQRFIQFIETRCPANTAAFYRAKMKDLLSFGPLANARLDRIDSALVERFVQHRVKQVAHPERKSSKQPVTPATVNRDLATLRRALRLAHEWKLITGVPRIKMLGGERNREFVLSREDEPKYLDACPEPLRDLALLILDTGLRVGEATRLAWPDVDFDTGEISIRKGKTKNAVRVLPLTDRALEMLKRRFEFCIDDFVFEQFCPTYWCRVHSRVRAKLGFERDFVIHSLRHTALSRLAVHTNVFTLCKIAGHGHVGTTQRYVHPAAESMRTAMKRLEAESKTGPSVAPEQNRVRRKAS